MFQDLEGKVRAVKGKAQLESIASYISQIERSPSLRVGYDKFIKLWKESTCIQGTDFMRMGYYDRILTICEANSSNVKAWQLLEEVIQRIRFALRQPHKSKTYKLLLDYLSKEFNNQQIRVIITSLISLINLSREDIVEFINFLLPRSLVVGSNPKPNMYIINLPIRVYNLRLEQNHNTYRVDFDLIYFQLHESKFSFGNTKVTYNLDELFNPHSAL